MPNTYRCKECDRKFGAWMLDGVSKVKGCPYCGCDDFDLFSTNDPVTPDMEWAEVEEI